MASLPFLAKVRKFPPWTLSVRNFLQRLCAVEISERALECKPVTGCEEHHGQGDTGLD